MPVPNNYAAEAARITIALERYETDQGVLPGLTSDRERESLIRQIMDSEARVRYTDTLLTRYIDPQAADPRDSGFHPLKASILHSRAGDFDEAVWMVFLYVHFGKHAKAGWWYIEQMYGACSATPSEWWTWHRTAEDPTSFRFWLDEHRSDFDEIDGPHGFGNHRKYVSLAAWTEQGTGAVVESYVDWVLEAGGDHAERFTSLMGETSAQTYDNVFKSLRAVRQFGRTARFDFVTMLGRLQLLNAQPAHAYMTNATGPLQGARLLLSGNKEAVQSARTVQQRISKLSEVTGITPDVLEDAICNWQKHPDRYVRFSA